MAEYNPITEEQYKLWASAWIKEHLYRLPPTLEQMRSIMSLLDISIEDIMPSSAKL